MAELVEVDVANLGFARTSPPSLRASVVTLFCAANNYRMQLGHRTGKTLGKPRVIGPVSWPMGW